MDAKIQESLEHVLELAFAAGDMTAVSYLIGCNGFPHDVRKAWQEKVRLRWEEIRPKDFVGGIDPSLLSNKERRGSQTI